jgi:hypothetical protein
LPLADLSLVSPWLWRGEEIFLGAILEGAEWCGMVRSEDERSAEIRGFLVMVNNGICIWDYMGLYGIIWDLMINKGFFMV